MFTVKTQLWIVRGVVALMFAIPAIFKLLGDQLWVDEFVRIGFGGWFMYAVAAIEIAAVVLVLRPSTTARGIAVLMMVTAGALVAQIALFGNFIHIAIYAAILVAALAIVLRSGNARNAKA
jgi:hypothetical protein